MIILQLWSQIGLSTFFRFWIIALPVMGVIIPMFLYQDIKSMVHYIHKVMAARRAVLAQERGPW